MTSVFPAGLDAMVGGWVLAAADPLSHVVNHPAVKTEGGTWIWSGNQGNLVIAGVLMIVVGLWAARRIGTGPASQGAEAYVTRNPFAHMLEVVCVYLRDEVARPLLHDRTTALMPFLWTLFFFILVNNLLGLVPLVDVLHLVGVEKAWIGGTATQNFFVTAALAVVAAVVFNVAAVVRLGPVGFVKHMLGGLPPIMFPIALLLFLIEALGQFVIKPFALALRLFANMTAGHVLLASLLMFAGAGVSKISAGEGFLSNGPVTVIWVVASLAVMFLELFVAFLQAFVFMFLTTIFISLMDHHDDEHGHEHEHGHAHGHEHAHA
ncbi:MAG: F0F1 ATP synthase subunit A [Phycisphaeraceae bacterium]|nr:MAG: F0F1 ATP synthase subunit A [Phycisphaeraceae bacterium]